MQLLFYTDKHFLQVTLILLVYFFSFWRWVGSCCVVLKLLGSRDLPPKQLRLQICATTPRSYGYFKYYFNVLGFLKIKYGL